MIATAAEPSLIPRSRQPAEKTDRKLKIIIAVSGAVSAAFYGTLGWGAYRIIERLVG